MSISKTALRTHAPDMPLSPAVSAETASPLPQDARMRAEIATYIFQMSGEMTGMARAAKMDLLAYFLEMARIEAGSLRQIDPS